MNKGKRYSPEFRERAVRLDDELKQLRKDNRELKRANEIPGYQQLSPPAEFPLTPVCVRVRSAQLVSLSA